MMLPCLFWQRSCMNLTLKSYVKYALPTLSNFSCENEVKNYINQNYSCYYTASHTINQRLLEQPHNLQLFVDKKHVKQFHVSNENFASKLKVPSIDIGQVISSIRSVKMIDLKDAPVPAFWTGLAGLLPFAFPPLQTFLFGYSPLLGTLQMAYGAAILAFLGGVKWGALVSGDKANLTWDNIILSVLPPVVSTAAVISPPLIGFLVVSAGLLGALAIDLTTSKYPPWFIALRSFLTTAAVCFLILSTLQCLIH